MYEGLRLTVTGFKIHVNYDYKTKHKMFGYKKKQETVQLLCQFCSQSSSHGLRAITAELLCYFVLVFLSGIDYYASVSSILLVAPSYADTI